MEGETSAAAKAKRTVTLRSSDGEIFQVEERIATVSKTIKNMIDDECGGGIIPVSNVTAKILAKVLEYCKKHADEDKSEHYFFGKAVKDDDVLRKWDSEFINVDHNTLFDLILAANYLDIQGLLDKGCEVVADTMRGKTPEQIREIFHIVNDYTPEEEQEVKTENSWAFSNAN